MISLVSKRGRLAGMRERMQIIGGTLQVRSAAGQGTTVTATVES